MAFVIALLALAGVLAWAAPTALARGSWQVRHPRTALLLWHLALLASCLAALGSVVVAIASAVSTTPQDRTATAVALTGSAWVGLGAAGALIAALAAGAGMLAEAHRRNEGAVYRLPHSIHTLPEGIALRVCETDEPFALALPGAGGEVAVSRGLADSLTDAQLRAVIAHEAAHLRGRHHLAMRLADLNIACLPKARVSRRFRRSTGLLLELIADDRAARDVGAVHLANALVRMGELTGDPSLELRAERLAERRWRPARHPGALPDLSARELASGA